MDRVGSSGEMNKGNAGEIQMQWKYYCKWAAGAGCTPLCPVAKVHPVVLATCYPLEYCISGCIAFTGMENKASVSYFHLHFCVWGFFPSCFFFFFLMFAREAKCFPQYLCGCCLVVKIWGSCWLLRAVIQSSWMGIKLKSLTHHGHMIFP